MKRGCDILFVIYIGFGVMGMNYYTELYLVPGNSHGAHIFHGCAEPFMNEAFRLLTTQKGSASAVCVKFGKEDEKIVEDFSKVLVYRDRDLFNQASRELFIARTYVDTKIFDQIFKSISDKNLSNSEFIELMREPVRLGMKMFEQRDYSSFEDYYKSIMLSNFVFGKVASRPRSWELCIFEKDLDNLAMQIAINNHIDHIKNYNVKVFTNQKFLKTYYNEGGMLLEGTHDYTYAEPFEILAEPENGE